MREPRVVTATIGPIKAVDIRFAALQKSDQEHPLTKTIYERLPRLPDEDLVALRAYLTGWTPNASGMCNVENIESWLRMVDAEITSRKVNRDSLVASIVAWLQPEGTK